MAYPNLRSCNDDLEAGMTDGLYRKIIMDRGGVVEPTTYAARRDLTDAWYGLHECPSMMTPDNMRVRNPYGVSTPEAVPGYF